MRRATLPEIIAAIEAMGGPRGLADAVEMEALLSVQHLDRVEERIDAVRNLLDLWPGTGQPHRAALFVDVLGAYSAVDLISACGRMASRKPLHGPPYPADLIVEIERGRLS